ncbi:ABC-type branched-subunit amino acid transport system substrate-binding protein [Saccharothrix coeruleofusca]|uniref:ABC transporter substrate-binding protein n=1 Tax=Saccharothrix coeruleofusca TaxID=33919 RepID=UPI001AE79705|nr:hypothetical protein [Saccharothrix coeruleofusca]MBP2337492.1 ABC-type branched-subunit amino acid transport system substrate-binding protein [Saccharothrix coeruleofusca]
MHFQGAVELVRLLDRLTRRPRWPRRDLPLPIVHLKHPAGVASPVDALANRPATTRGSRVAFARVDGGGNDPRGLRPVLDDAVAQLAGKVRGVSPLRFPHYALVVWLLELRVPAEVGADDEERAIAHEFRNHLRHRIRLGSGPTGQEVRATGWDIAQDFPWWIRLVIALTPRIGLALTAMLWRPATWVGQQPVAGRSGLGLYRLARAFVKEEPADAHPDDVRHLLVQAFLEDLRRSHRRWTPWGTGRRRTGHPWLLVEGVGDATAGEELVEAIGRARNTAAETVSGRRWWRVDHLSRLDPLLVVTAGEWSGPEDVRGVHPADAPAGYRDWLALLARSGNWVLRFDVDPRVPAPGVAGALSQVEPLRLRRAVTAPLVLTLFAASLAGVPLLNHARCDVWWSPSMRSPLVRVGADCVGVSADPLRDFVPDGLPAEIRADLGDVYGRIMATNAKAAAKPDVVTVVFLSILTPSTANSYQALVEELRGVWVAQNTSSIPIKVLLANGGEGPGGQGLEFGGIAADKIIALAADDPSVVAVTGLTISTNSAKTAIRRLGGNALPVVGILTSADDMAEVNEYYYQVGPNNRREARVAAFYADRHLGIGKVSIFYSGDPSDRYSQNLAEDANTAFAERGIEVTRYEKYRVTTEDGVPPFTLGQSACSDEPGHAVFYAGRAQYLPDFLHGMNSKCQSSTPPVISGDSGSRFVLDGRMAEFPNVRLDYMSFANPSAWTDCAKVPFYKYYLDVFGGTCATMRDGRSAAGHDAVQVIAEGVRQVRRTDPEAPVRPGLLAEISNIRAENAIQGATGVIGFGTNSRVPVDKAILVLRGNADRSSTPLLLCGELPFRTELIASLVQPSDCPEDR